MVMIMKWLRIGNCLIIHSQASINITCYLGKQAGVDWGGSGAKEWIFKTAVDT